MPQGICLPLSQAATVSPLSRIPVEKASPPRPATHHLSTTLSQRGQDGHLKLTSNDDFFNDPLGSDAGCNSPGGGGFGGGGGSSGWGRASRSVPAGPPATTSDASGSAAQARFGSAKAISSAAYFNQDKGENDYEKQARLAKFSVSGGACGAEGRAGGAEGMEEGTHVNDNAPRSISVWLSLFT